MKFEKITWDEAVRQVKECSLAPSSYNLCESLSFVLLPTRGTSGSAGYDFRSPFSFTLEAGDAVRIPLFVKIKDMPTDVVLLMFNRSGLSLKHGLRLDNAVGVIDSDYKEGIWFQATATKPVSVEKGDRICQGVFVKYVTVDGDKATASRNGGLGSTGR